MGQEFFDCARTFIAVNLVSQFLSKRIFQGREYLLSRTNLPGKETNSQPLRVMTGTSFT